MRSRFRVKSLPDPECGGAAILPLCSVTCGHPGGNCEVENFCGASHRGLTMTRHPERVRYGNFPLPCGNLLRGSAIGAFLRVSRRCRVPGKLPQSNLLIFRGLPKSEELGGSRGTNTEPTLPLLLGMSLCPGRANPLKSGR